MKNQKKHKSNQSKSKCKSKLLSHVTVARAAALGLEKLRPHFALIRWLKLAPPMHRTLRDSEKRLPSVSRVLLNSCH